MNRKDGGETMPVRVMLSTGKKPVSLALFDFDGTLIPGDSVTYYLRFFRYFVPTSFGNMFGNFSSRCGRRPCTA